MAAALDEHLAPRRDHGGVAGVAQLAALADAVDAGDVAEVLDRAGAQERAPVLAARLRPVGDEGEEVRVLGGEAEGLRKAQVVADEGRDADAVDGHGDDPVAARVDAVLAAERERVDLGVARDRAVGAREDRHVARPRLPRFRNAREDPERRARAPSRAGTSRTARPRGCAIRSDSIEKPVQNISGSSARRAPFGRASSSRRRARAGGSPRRPPRRGPSGRGRHAQLLQSRHGRLERLPLLAEREAHVGLPVLGVVVEHPRRDRGHADLLDQVAREDDGRRRSRTGGSPRRRSTCPAGARRGSRSATARAPGSRASPR